MIITRIIGGLGNQLFQFAAAKSLALHHNTSLKLDVSLVESGGIRKIDLPLFNIVYDIATSEEINSFNKLSLTTKIIQQFLPAHKRNVYKEPGFTYDPHFFRAPHNCYLKGYWQSPKYFENIEGMIQKEFTVRTDAINTVVHLAAKFNQEESVSVHIRRGDYLDKTTVDFHGILSPGYYMSAIQLMKKQYPLCRFYFFSDDIEWVKKNIPVDIDHEFISGTHTHTAIEDFYLMSQCKHNIIANSSFSWWAAWLNKNPGKLVIAPDKWFDKANLNTKDLIPENWIRI